MSPFHPFPWQNDPWRQLRKRIDEGRFPHALLLTGPAGVGKRRFAQAAAAALLCRAPDPEGRACGECRSCLLLHAGTHPDLLVVEPEELGKDLRIDAVRRVTEFQSLTPQYGERKAVVLAPAERMTTAAANAVLKTLEEPAPHTMLLLCADQPSRLLPTVRSRCQKLPLQSQESGTEAIAWLREAAPDHDPAVLLALAAGAPLRALQMVEEGRLAIRQTLFEATVAVSDGSADPVAVAEQVQKEAGGDAVEWLLGWAGDLLRLATAGEQASLRNPDLRSGLWRLAQGQPAARLVKLLDRNQELVRYNRNSINLQLLLEELFISWSRFFAAARASQPS